MEGFASWLLDIIEEDIVTFIIIVGICSVLLTLTMIVYTVLWAIVKVIEILIKSIFADRDDLGHA